MTTLEVFVFAIVAGWAIVILSSPKPKRPTDEE
jgi:hypothetical protein